jgi:hypothetical protein
VNNVMLHLVRPVEPMHVPAQLCDAQTVKLNDSNEFCFIFSSFL